jgi:hypothetical protein
VAYRPDQVVLGANMMSAILVIESRRDAVAALIERDFDRG